MHNITTAPQHAVNNSAVDIAWRFVPNRKTYLFNLSLTPELLPLVANGR
jgi:hypothetical protein